MGIDIVFEFKLSQRFSESLLVPGEISIHGIERESAACKLVE